MWFSRHCSPRWSLLLPTWPSSVSVEAAPPATPTFNKDVLPVLQRAVSGLPSAELDRADVVHDLQGYAAVRAGHRKSGRRPDDAAVVCGPDGRAFQEHRSC